MAARAPLGGFFTALILAGAIGARPAPAQQMEKITTSAVKVSSIGSLLIAEHNGYFKDQGIDVTNLYSDSGSASILAVASGSADVAAGALGASIFNIAGKGGMKIVAGQSVEKPGYHSSAIVATNAAWNAGLKGYKDLVGKRVGIVSAGGSSQYILDLAAQKYGFSVATMTVLPLQNNANVLASIRGGQIDAAVAPLPLPAQVEAEGIGHVIGWVDEETPFQEGAVFANTKLLQTRPDTVKRYLAAYAKGCADYDAAFNQLDGAGQRIKGPNHDAYLKLVADTLGVPGAQIESSFSYCQPGLKLDLAELGNQLNFWKSVGAVDKSVELDQVVVPMTN